MRTDFDKNRKKRISIFNMELLEDMIVISHTVNYCDTNQYNDILKIGMTEMSYAGSIYKYYDLLSIWFDSHPQICAIKDETGNIFITIIQRNDDCVYAQCIVIINNCIYVIPSRKFKNVLQYSKIYVIKSDQAVFIVASLKDVYTVMNLMDGSVMNYLKQGFFPVKTQTEEFTNLIIRACKYPIPLVRQLIIPADSIARPLLEIPDFEVIDCEIDEMIAAEQEVDKWLNLD